MESEFKPPVTHWVGAAWKNGKAYFRGVVDAAAKDLKRWIRSNRIKQVSIYGIPKLVKVAGETQVVDYMLLSIDWTPLDRAGMPTRIVAIGEIDQIIGGGETVTFQELIDMLKKKLAIQEITQGQLAGEIAKVLNDPALMDRTAYNGGEQKPTGSMLVSRKVSI